MSPQAEHFLAKLHERAGKGVRVLPDVYRGAFADVCPTLAAEEFRVRLSAICEELEAGEYISLPRSKRLYDRAGTTKLPAWIDLARNSSSPEPLPLEPTTFPWAPELRFACDIRDARQLGILLRIQDFLSNSGRNRPMVPAKERSVQLFGDEKRLERMKAGALFAPGRLTFDLLRCYVVLPPIVFDALASTQEARPILVLENYSTYHTFARWNRQVGWYEAVVYGNGDSFETAVAGFAAITPAMKWDGRIFYFGDLDVKGLLIPVAASQTLNALQSSRLEPHMGCYRRLLECASSADLPPGVAQSIPRECRQWLGEQMAKEVEVWLNRGIRLPQELVGWEELSQDVDSFAQPLSRCV